MISECSFCGKSQADVRLLIAGAGGVNICSDCLDVAQQVIDQDAGWSGPPVPGDYHCSFCGRPNREVRHLVAGPNRIYICDGCVASSRRITTSV